MDPEKGKDVAGQADNSDDVVTKETSGSEDQDAIVYPNVFWTSCISFGVALGLFLVICRVEFHGLSRPTLLTIPSQVGLDMVSA